ncbi:MAG: tetratricopeptide repeat protein [Longimicrobiales bacterium]|nr:tetratricopeptide repeat protein [Longimicrobiales bacterium]
MTQRSPGQRRAASDKQELDEDVFIARILEIGNWLKTHQQAVTIGLVVLVVAVASLVYYRRYSGSLTEQASNQLEQIHQSVALGDARGAQDALILFLDRFGSTPYAGEARMLLGELYLTGNEAEQALAVLEPMAESPREPLELQAAALLAAAYEQEGRWADAEATYLRIADRSELDFQVRDALAAAARIRAAQGNPTGAAELYQRILDGLDENALDRGTWEMRLAEVGKAG